MKALGAFIFHGGFSIGVKRAGFDVLAHLEGAGAYGADTMKLNWPWLPVYSPEAAWPVKSFQGVDFVYANPPCFTPDTRVLTRDGPVMIGDLVKSRATVEVATIDATGALVYRPITGWHANPYEGDLYDVGLRYWTIGGRNVGRARATANHRFMTKRGWVPAAELTATDEVCVGKLAPNARQMELINGLLLGDATIKKHQAQFVVSSVTTDYARATATALKEFVSASWWERPREPIGSYNRRPDSGFYLRTEGWVYRLRDRWYDADRKKRVPHGLRLTPLTLAAWYMDDGCLRGVNKPRSAATVRRNGRNGGYGGLAQLCTDGFSPEDVERLMNLLRDLGIACRRSGKSERAQKYPRIAITADGFRAFVELIGPYVVPGMRYKLPTWAPAFDPSRWDLGCGEVDYDNPVVRRAKQSTRAKVYCLDVYETHNFVTYGGVAHNCAIFSPMGIITTRGQDSWRTDPRLGCWHQSFRLLEELDPPAWALESVPQAYTKGREVVDDFTKRALMRGYSVVHLFIDAKWMGLSQSRKRFFLLCHKGNRFVGANLLNWAPPPTIGDALGMVDDPGHVTTTQPKYLEALAVTPMGSRLSTAWEELNPGFETRLNKRGQVAGRPSFQDRRLHTDEQMGAYVGDKFYHPLENRLLGINEAKAICGYPLDWQLAGRPGEWGSHLARGVMPPVGEWLAKAVMATIETGRISVKEQRSVTRVDLREPGIEPVDLTKEYLDDRGRVRFVVRAASRPLDDNGAASTSRVEDDFPEEAKAAAYAPQSDFVGWQDNQSFTQRETNDGKREAGDGSVDRGSDNEHDQSEAGRGPDREVVEDRRQPRLEGDRGAAQEAADGGPARASRSPKPVIVGEPPAGHPTPIDGEGSGAFIQRVYLLGRYSPDEIVNIVHACYPGRNTRRSDVYYNYKKLQEQHKNPPPWNLNRIRVVKTRDPAPRSPAGAAPASPPGAVSNGSPTASPAVGEHLRPRPNPGGPRFLVTGSTPMQVGSEKTQLKILTSARCYVAALEDMGYDVEWRKVEPGEDLSTYAGVLVALNKPNAIVSQHFYGALWALLKRPDAVIFLDDWQTKELIPGVRSFTKDKTRAFRLSEWTNDGKRFHLGESPYADELFVGLNELTTRWRWPVVAPIFEGGRPELLELPADVTAIDPTAYALRYPRVDTPRQRKWVQASLLLKPPPDGVTWPVEFYGNAGKGRGGVGKSDERDSQPRLSEPELMAVYCGARGILSPAHNHPGSGWWRVRYLMAADAGCVLSAHPDEGAVIGSAYVQARPRFVEGLSDEGLDTLAANQAQQLANKAMSKDQVKDLLQELIEREITNERAA